MKRTLTAFVHASLNPSREWNPSAEEFTFSLFSRDMSTYGGCGKPIAQIPIEFTVPSRDALIALEISAIDAQIQNVRAKAESEVTVLTERRTKLLALPNEAAHSPENPNSSLHSDAS